MTDAEKLVAIAEIGRLKAAYFRYMDTKNWTDFGDLFTTDASFDARGALEMPKTEEAYAAEPIISGRAAILEYVSNGIKPLVSVHHGHMPEIEVLSATTATGIWAMSDMLIMRPGATFHTFRGWGHYHETYAWDGRWRIATLRLRRLYVETV